MKKYLIGTIIFSLVFSSIFLFSFQKAEAVGLEVPVAEGIIRQKEAGISLFGVAIPGSGWDALAWLAANIVIRHLVDDTVQWINSGFNGSPFFVTNPGDFLMEAGNQASGLFLAKLKLTGLCSNWEPMIKIALQSQQPFNQRMQQCTIGRVIDNYDAFMNDFTQGGWAGWIAVTQSDSNPYGLYLSASDEMARQVLDAQNQAQTKANWGKGFLSQEECAEIDGDVYDDCVATGSTPVACEKKACVNWQIQTPGTTIENRLTAALGTDFARLVSPKYPPEFPASTHVLSNPSSMYLKRTFSGALKLSAV